MFDACDSDMTNIKASSSTGATRGIRINAIIILSCKLKLPDGPDDNNVLQC